MPVSIGDEVPRLRTSGKPGRIAELLGLPEGQILPELSNHIPFVRRAEDSLDHLTPSERTFRLVDEVLLEVNTGGFYQYFENSSGDHALEAVGALETVRAGKTAALLKAAVELFGPSGPTPEREARAKQLASLGPQQTKRLDLLTEVFFQEDDAHEVLLPFVLQHRDDFKDQ